MNSSDITNVRRAALMPRRYRRKALFVQKWNEFMKDVMLMETDERTGAQPLLEEVFYLA